MEVIRSSETSVYIRATWCSLPEDGNIHNYRCENLKSCIEMLHVRMTNLYYIIAIKLLYPRTLSFRASFLIRHRIIKIAEILRQIVKFNYSRIRSEMIWTQLNII
jgi:hypothetical protein